MKIEFEGSATQVIAEMQQFIGKNPSKLSGADIRRGEITEKEVKTIAAKLGFTKPSTGYDNTHRVMVLFAKSLGLTP